MTTIKRNWKPKHVQSKELALIVQTEFTTHKAGQSAQASTVSAASQGAELALGKEFGDSQGCAVNCILFPATAGTARLIKELGRLGHRHADQLRLRATAAATTTGRKFLERLRTTGVQIAI